VTIATKDDGMKPISSAEASSIRGASSAASCGVRGECNEGTECVTQCSSQNEGDGCVPFTRNYTNLSGAKEITTPPCVDGATCTYNSISASAMCVTQPAPPIQP
jgi:hypothetical protein